MSDDPKTSPCLDPGPIDSEQARELVEDGAILVDVRSPAEYRRCHIDGAINIPVHLLSAYFGRLAEQDCPVIVYCRNGERSFAAYLVLRQRGLDAVYDLGTMDGW